MNLNLRQLKCKTCGEPLDPATAKDGVIRCEICNSVFTLPKETADQKILDFLSQGEHDLDTGKFDDAYTAFYKASELDPAEPEAYWGMALADFKVQYLKDEVNNRLQPICCAVTDKKFIQNDNFMRALVHGTSAQIAEYKSKAAEIEYINGEFYKLNGTGLDYDCFICVKVSDDDNGGHTVDRTYADNIYEALRRKGYKPFFSERELFNVTGADYEARILYALHSSECMLVVCTDEKYLQTKWVKNEYKRFLQLVNDKEKESDSITMVFADNPIEKLPGKNGKIQGINIKSFDAMEKIISFVESHTPEARKRRELAEEEKKHKEDAILKQIEEQEKKRKELEEKLNSMRSSAVASPASSSVQSLLTRANQELQFDHRDKAKEYYERVLDIMPDCADAWFGLALLDFNCTSDEELLVKIQKTTSDDNAYDILFALPKNNNLIQADKYADGELKERVKTIFKAVNDKKKQLCRLVKFDATKFYNEILKNDGDKPYSAYATHCLFLIKNGSKSTDEILQKLELRGEIGLSGLKIEVEKLKEQKNLPQGLAEQYDEILQQLNTLSNARLTDKCNVAEKRLAELQAKKPEYEAYAKEIEAKEKAKDELNSKNNELYNNKNYNKKHRTRETGPGNVMYSIWQDKYVSIIKKAFLPMGCCCGFPFTLFDWLGRHHVALWILLGFPIFLISLCTFIYGVPFTAILGVVFIVLLTIVFALTTVLLSLVWVPCKIIKTFQNIKYCAIQRKIDYNHTLIFNLDNEINSYKRRISDYENDILTQQNTIKQCDEEFIK